MVTAHKMPPSQVQQAHLCEASRGGLAGSGDMSFSGHPAQPLPAAGEKATEPGEHDLCRCQVKKKEKGRNSSTGIHEMADFYHSSTKNLTKLTIRQSISCPHFSAVNHQRAHPSLHAHSQSHIVNVALMLSRSR